jgi:hypothetical protein
MICVNNEKIIYNNEKVIYNEDKQALKLTINRLPNNKFKVLNIKYGTTLNVQNKRELIVKLYFSRKTIVFNFKNFSEKNLKYNMIYGYVSLELNEIIPEYNNFIKILIHFNYDINYYEEKFFKTKNIFEQTKLNSMIQNFENYISNNNLNKNFTINKNMGLIEEWPIIHQYYLNNKMYEICDYIDSTDSTLIDVYSFKKVVIEYIKYLNSYTKYCYNIVKEYNSIILVMDVTHILLTKIMKLENNNNDI